MTQQTVPIAKIVLGENPRTYFDPDDLTQLERSIKVFGLLTPIAVEETPEGEFKLIAGERRLRAMTNLGETEIPAHVTTVADHAGAAIAENVVRVNLHPIEEGRAYLNLLKKADGKTIKPLTLSKQLGIPAKRIVDRLRLAQLPTELADAMISGARIDRIRDLLVEFLEAFGPDVVVAFVTSHLEALNEVEPGDTQEMHEIFAHWLELQSPPPAIEVTWQMWKQLPDEVAHALLEEAATKRTHRHDAETLLDLRTEEDLAAAKSYGCLVVFEGAEQYSSDIVYLTDLAWYADRVRYNIGQAEDRTTGANVALAKRRIDPETGEVQAPTTEELAAEEAERKAQKKAEALAAKAEREERGRINQAFGLNLTRKLSKRKLTHADAKLLAQMVLEGEHNTGLAWQLVKPDEPVEGADRFQKARTVAAWVQKGKNADEVIGRLLQLLLASTFVDRQAVVKSKQPDTAFYSAHLHESDHLLALLETVGPEEISGPWIEARSSAKELAAKYAAENAARAAHLAEQQKVAKKPAAKVTDGPPFTTGIDPSDVSSGAPLLEGEDDDPDPTAEPVVLPEEADEPLLSEQVTTSRLPDNGSAPFGVDDSGDLDAFIAADKARDAEAPDLTEEEIAANMKAAHEAELARTQPADDLDDEQLAAIRGATDEEIS